VAVKSCKIQYIIRIDLGIFPQVTCVKIFAIWTGGDLRSWTGWTTTPAFRHSAEGIWFLWLFQTWCWRWWKRRLALGAIPAGDMRPGMSMGATRVPMWRPGRILLCCNSFGSGSGLVVAIRQNGLQIYEITSKHPKHCGLCSSAPNAFVSSDVWPPRHARNDFVEMSSYPGALGQLAHFLSNNLQQCIWETWQWFATHS
jgi:hypothetical protein